ncbi:MAG: 30S ribosomal protein S4, partial [Myxococcales bacterium]|nr:30S ribosomal protein S4 [Myxococcales bacterium]
IYGVMERQFRRTFAEAERMRGVTGENLLSLLERRLDNVVFRLGFATTRAEARQTVRHGHVAVNGRKVSIPSFLVEPGDEISIRERSRGMARVAAAIEFAERRGIPEWLSLDRERLVGKVASMPNREEITLPIREQLVVEFYSR